MAHGSSGVPTRFGTLYTAGGFGVLYLRRSTLSYRFALQTTITSVWECFLVTGAKNVLDFSPDVSDDYCFGRVFRTAVVRKVINFTFK
jgi:hypothetical protein